MKLYTFEGEKGENVIESEIPADLKEEAMMWREEMIDTVSVFDDELAEKFLEGEEISEELINRAIRNGVVKNDLYPIMCGSALRNSGVQLLLDAVVNYLPSPLDRGEVFGTDPNDEEKKIGRKPEEDGPVAAVAFKIATDPFVGTLTFVRVYSGTVKSGDSLLNPITGKKERVGRLLLMHSNKREEISEIGAGQIAAFLGLKDTQT